MLKLFRSRSNHHCPSIRRVQYPRYNLHILEQYDFHSLPLLFLLIEKYFFSIFLITSFSFSYELYVCYNHFFQGYLRKLISFPAQSLMKRRNKHNAKFFISSSFISCSGKKYYFEIRTLKLEKSSNCDFCNLNQFYV